MQQRVFPTLTGPLNFAGGEDGAGITPSVGHEAPQNNFSERRQIFNELAGFNVIAKPSGKAALRIDARLPLRFKRFDASRAFRDQRPNSPIFEIACLLVPFNQVACCVLGLWPKHSEALKSESSRPVSIGHHAFARAHDLVQGCHHLWRLLLGSGHELRCFSFSSLCAMTIRSR